MEKTEKARTETIRTKFIVCCAGLSSRLVCSVFFRTSPKCGVRGKVGSLHDVHRQRELVPRQPRQGKHPSSLPTAAVLHSKFAHSSTRSCVPLFYAPPPVAMRADPALRLGMGRRQSDRVSTTKPKPGMKLGNQVARDSISAI